MRRSGVIALALLVLVLAGGLAPTGPALAQGRPPDLQPLPEPPPPPPIPGADEPSVRIPVQENDKVEEVRDGGRVVMIRVTPAGGGKPYYLLDTTGSGNWMRRDSLDSGMRPPQWPIMTFD